MYYVNDFNTFLKVVLLNIKSAERDNLKKNTYSYR